jgi:hypothetical protein
MVGGYQRFGELYCLHFQNGGSIFLRNTGIHLPDYTETQTRTSEYESSQPWEPEISNLFSSVSLWTEYGGLYSYACMSTVFPLLGFLPCCFSWHLKRWEEPWSAWINTSKARILCLTRRSFNSPKKYILFRIKTNHTDVACDSVQIQDVLKTGAFK